MKITLPERLAGTRDALFVLEVEFPVATEERKVEVTTEGSIEALDLRGTGPGGTYEVPVGLERLHIPMRVTSDQQGEAKVKVACVAGPEQGTAEERTLLLEKGPGAPAGSGAGGKWALVALLVAALGAAAIWAGPKLFGGDKVPSVTGLSQNEAIAKLQKAEYRYEIVTQDIEDRARHGVAIRTIPAGGAKLAKGERVQLVVGTALERMVKVDSVKGQTEAAAVAALKAAGFQPVTQYVDAGPGDELGRVLRQSPAGGTHLERGQEVELFVARAATPQPDVPQPDVPQPDVPQPDVPQPDVPQPDVPQPDVPQPDVPQPDVPQPDVPQPDVPQPDVPAPPDGLVNLPKLVGLKLTAAEAQLERLGLLAIPESKPVDDPARDGLVLAQFPEFDAQTPEFVAPGGQVYLTVGRYEKPAVPQPDVPQPDVPQPDVPQPDVPQPDVPQPDVPQPDVPQPDVPQPDVPQPDVPQPDVPQPEDKAVVPDVIAMTRERATGLVRQAGLHWRTKLEETTELPDGQIVSQFPMAGERMKRGSTVDLVIARAPATAGIPVPDVLGMTREEAERVLRGEGFRVNPVYSAGPLADLGKVVSQAPPAGAPVDRHTWVGIAVIGGSGPERQASAGPPRTSVGETEGPAPRAPAGSGQLERAPTTGTGPIVAPAPTEHGARPARPVTLPGRDTEPTQTVPDVKGTDIREAIRQILVAGLMPVVRPDRVTAEGADGTVTRVRPAAGTAARPGDLVHVDVRLAPRPGERYVTLPTALSGFVDSERRGLQAAGYQVEVVEVDAPGHPYAGTGRVMGQYPVSAVPRSLAQTVTLWVVR